MKFLLVLLMLVAVSRAVIFDDCQSRKRPRGGKGQPEGATVSSVTISGCDDGAEECTFIQGSKYDVSITFTAYSMPDALKVTLTASTHSYQTQLDLDNPDVCDVVGGCPLTEGAEYTYTSSFDLGDVPDELVKLYFQFFTGEEDQGNGFVCVTVKGQVEKQE